MHVFLSILASLLVCLFAPNVLAQDDELEKVRLQLRWHHQYQFAGYYAAKHKGFYEQAGFDVEIVSGNPYRLPVEEVLAGRADFAEGNGEVLLSRLRGEPLVALAAVFQHSPSVLITLKESNFRSPSDLVGKRVMLVGGEADADLIAMFHADGVDMKDIDVIDSSFDLNDLIDGKTDAFNSYLTNEPYFIEQQGYDHNILSPKDYGVNFYSDILFTTEAQVKNDPERVERFKQASLKGWQYAIKNSEEIIRLIHDEYNSEKSFNHMRYEALTVNSLVKSDLLPIGHIFPERLERMADVFIAQNMVADKRHFRNFIFEPPQQVSDKHKKWVYISIAILSISAFGFSFFAHLNRKLKQEIAQRGVIEEQLRLQASTDSLTGLLNRRAFVERYKYNEALAKRQNKTFSLVLFDLDYFKVVNDKYGHENGDKVLLLVAKVMNQTLRKVDIFARFGGEEFIVLLPDTTLAQSLNLMERLKSELQASSVVVNNDTSIGITASFGVVQWTDESMDELLSKVDQAMYKAKYAGRNQIRTIPELDELDCSSNPV